MTWFGISPHDTVTMVAHYEHPVLAEGRTWDAAVAIDGAAHRLVPTPTMSPITGSGLRTLALGAGEPGRATERPMALIILGALANSPVLILAVLRALALRFARFREVPA